MRLYGYVSYMYLLSRQLLELKLAVSQGAAAFWTLRSGGRAGVRRLHFLMHFFDLFDLVEGDSTGSGRYPFVLVANFHVECIKHHVWGQLGARDMSILVTKHIF